MASILSRPQCVNFYGDEMYFSDACALHMQAFVGDVSYKKIENRYSPITYVR